MNRKDRDELITALRFCIAGAHNDARARFFSEDEQRAVWHDSALQKRMAAVRADTIDLPIELAEFMVDLLAGEESVPRGHHKSAAQRAMCNLAKAEYEKRLAAAKAAGVPNAKDAVLENMGEQVRLSADRISQMVWPRR